MSGEDVYTAMGGPPAGTLSPTSPTSPSSASRRPLSRILSHEEPPNNHRAGSRLSRSQTLMYPSSAGRPMSPGMPVKPRSPTYVGALDHLDRSPRRMHGSIDNSDWSQPHTQTLAHLQRSMTTKAAGGVYGKNPWDEDEYVDTGGKSSRSPTPTGGAAARRINQRGKMATSTIKHPTPSFVDADYADMTGHQNDAGGMAQLRHTHQYKSVKARSPHTVRPDFQAAFDEAAFDGDGSVFTRNYSGSSEMSANRSPAIKRSETTPVLSIQGTEYHTTPMDGQVREIHGNGHVTSGHRGIAEVDGPEPPPTIAATMKPSPSLHSAMKDRQDSLKKPTVETSSLGRSAKSHLPVVASPAHSAVSAETVVSNIPQSTPASPAVRYKKEGESVDANVAVVVEEIVPKPPSKPDFAEADRRSKKPFIILLFVLCVAIIVGLTVAVAILALKIGEKQQDIDALLARVRSETTTRSDAIAADPTTMPVGNEDFSTSDLSTTTYADDTTTLATVQQTTYADDTTTAPTVLATTASELISSTKSSATNTTGSGEPQPTASSSSSLSAQTSEHMTTSPTTAMFNITATTTSPNTTSHQANGTTSA